MNNKLLSTSFIISIILTVALIIQPKMAAVTAQEEEELIVFGRICPIGEVYQGDTVKFGGSIFNNLDQPQVLYGLLVNVYNETGTHLAMTTYERSFADQPMRNVIQPYETRHEYFEQEIDLPIAENYTLMLFFQYYEEGTSLGDRPPPMTQIGENVTLDVLIRRPEAPVYIYVVLFLLILAILTFVVAGVGSWIRERRSK